MQAFIEEGQFTQARLQSIEVINRVREDFMVRFERYFRPRFFARFQRTYLLERFIRHAAGKGNGPQIAIAFDLDLCPDAEGVDDGNADTVKAAGNGIAVAAKFPAGMKDRQDNFDSRFTDFMHGDRNTAAIIDDSDAVVILNGYFNMSTISSQGFIDTVIDDFVDQMMKAPCRCTADVHPRPLADGFQSFQYLNLFGTISSFVFRHRDSQLLFLAILMIYLGNLTLYYTVKSNIFEYIPCRMQALLIAPDQGLTGNRQGKDALACDDQAPPGPFRYPIDSDQRQVEMLADRASLMA